MSDGGTSRLQHVQGLRGVAMLTIVVYHCDLPPRGGFLAIDTFFVISGYVIAGMLLRRASRGRRISLLDFYHRRLRRLLPMLATVIVATVLLSAALESPLDGQRSTGRIGAWASVSLANVALYKTGNGYFDAAAETLPLRHLWSLSVEEQFYLVFPVFVIAVFALARRRPARALALGAGAVMALSYASLVLAASRPSLGIINDTSAFAYYSPVTRVWEMGAGVLLASWHQVRPPLRATAARVATVLGSTLLGLSVLTLDSDQASGRPILIVPVLGSVLLLAGARSGGLVTRALAWRPLTWVGDRSYGWYLWHWPLIVFAGREWPDSTAVLLVAAVLGLAMSAVTHPLVEERFRYPPRDRDRSLQVRSASSLAVVCLTLSVGASLALNRAATHGYDRPDLQSMAAQVLPRPPGAIQDGCPVARLAAGEPATVCAIAPGEGRPIYLVGDSNAGQFGPALIAAGRVLDRPVFALWRPGCAFNFASVLRPDYDTPGCDRHNLALVAWLERAERGTVVVANGGEFVGARSVSMRWASGERDVGTEQPKAALWTRGLTAALRALRGTGHRVESIRLLPHPGGVNDEGQARWSPRDCGLVRLVLSGDLCAISVRLATEDARQSKELAVEDAATAAAGVEQTDLRAVVCPDGVCATRRGSLWVYRDSTHVTNRRSEALAPYFVRLLT